MAEENDHKTWREKTADWLFAQGLGTVLLLLLVAGLLWFGHYAIETGIPRHLDQIQQGYKEISDKHEIVVKHISDRNESTIKQVIDQNDRDRQAILSLVKKIREQDAIANRRD